MQSMLRPSGLAQRAVAFRPAVRVVRTAPASYRHRATGIAIPAVSPPHQWLHVPIQLFMSVQAPVVARRAPVVCAAAEPVAVEAAPVEEVAGPKTGIAKQTFQRGSVHKVKTIW